MNIDKIVMLPKIISSTENLAEEFKELFGSSEAKRAKGVVYFFMSEKPVPRVSGASNILYIGKTKQSIKQRYHQYSKNLASSRSGEFYRHIIDNYGGIKMGYIKVDNPKETESEYFNEYRATHLEFPPKSKVG
ncbi:hypothetical protein ACMXYW_01055 [Neptuniibacter sp. QD48_55]|uniref:hypothetical protein n=1 Tax=Neptuniibacter sp. QD48_55 TaxID=3398212 RepID=UPI0039F55006